MAKKQYKVVLVDGKELRKYDDGSIRDSEGRIKTISPERARMMQQKRQVKGMFLAGDAIQEATDSESVDEGVKKIVKKRLEVALTDEGRAGNDAARWFLQMAGYLNLEKKVDVEVKHRVPQMQLDDETKEVLMQLIRERRQTDHARAAVIDAEAKDMEDGDFYKE